MVVPNLVFDVLLFGLVFLAAVVDSVFPMTQGAISLVLVGAITYWAAQELAEAMLRRAGWSQDALSTSVTLTAGAFVYYWWRNQSDFALLCLSLGLMMASLMVSISILSAISSVVREGNGTAVYGWAATTGGSVLLGTLAGVLALVLGDPGEATPLLFKALAVLLALGLWKVREKANPPAANPHYHTQEAQRSVGVAPAITNANWALFPHRGTTLDRLLPLLVLGVVLLVGSRQLRPAAPLAEVEPESPALPAT